MPLFKQLPIQVEARMWDPNLDEDHAADVADWCKGIDPVDTLATNRAIGILTEFGVMWARPGDYIILDQLGDFRVMSPELFRAGHEPLAQPITITKRIGNWWAATKPRDVGP
jgi:hypothetical protein